MSLQQVIELKLKSFDHRVLDQAVSDIMGTVLEQVQTLRALFHFLDIYRDSQLTGLHTLTKKNLVNNLKSESIRG